MAVFKAVKVKAVDIKLYKFLDFFCMLYFILKLLQTNHFRSSYSFTPLTF